jgi:hypothetical protein
MMTTCRNKVRIGVAEEVIDGKYTEEMRTRSEI